MDQLEKDMLEKIADIHSVPEGAYNIRSNGKLESRNTTANIDIVTKKDKPGIDIIIKPHTKNESVHIPVILSQSGLNDMVYNDFYIGEGADVVIVAGCGIHNCGTDTSEHDGIHTFFIGKDAKVKYIEKHYGEGDGTGEKILNPTTIVHIDEGGYMEMETTQIKGVDSTIRDTSADLKDGATLVIREKIMTHGNQTAETNFKVELNGEDSSANVISRSVAKGNSRQVYNSRICGNNKCYGHTECDAILMDNGKVNAIPALEANDLDASLIHEAAIGKIAGEPAYQAYDTGTYGKRSRRADCQWFMK